MTAEQRRLWLKWAEEDAAREQEASKKKAPGKIGKSGMSASEL